MKVKDVMTPGPVACAPNEHLGTAVWRMWKGDCGLLPVTHAGRVVGVITDRDIAITLGLRGRRPEDVLVGEVMQGNEAVTTCDPEDSTSKAMALMVNRQLRRLPVVEDGELIGIVSLNDLALGASAGANGVGRPTFRDIAQTLRGICAHRSGVGAACAEEPLPVHNAVGRRKRRVEMVGLA